MLFGHLSKLSATILVLCGALFAQQIDSVKIAAIPDNIRKKLKDENAVFSIEEARILRTSILGDSVIMEREKDTLVVPKDSLYGSHVSPLIVSAELLGQNAIVWAWDYYVLDKDYAHTGPSYWKRNFREGWKWDHNHWAINFYGHPYQGSMYYAAARGSGYGFYSSLLFAALGSSTWEMFCETEYPAPNDLISTSIAGSMFGEALYRLSRVAYNKPGAPWYRQLAAFVLEPAG